MSICYMSAELPNGRVQMRGHTSQVLVQSVWIQGFIKVWEFRTETFLINVICVTMAMEMVRNI